MNATDDENYEHVTGKKIGAIKLTRFVDEEKISQIQIKDENDKVQLMNIADFHKSWLRRKLFALPEVIFEHIVLIEKNAGFDDLIKNFR